MDRYNELAKAISLAQLFLTLLLTGEPSADYDRSMSLNLVALNQ